MPRTVIKVTGLREFIRAADASQIATKKVVRDRLRKVGGIVAEEARRLISTKYPPSAAYRASVRRTGYVAVESSKRKTTRAHPEWGAYQMRHALIPAGWKKRAEAEAEMEKALFELAEVFDGAWV